MPLPHCTRGTPLESTLLLRQALGSDEQRCTMVKTEVVNLRSELEALEAENNGMSDGAELQVLWWRRRRWW